MKICLIMPNVFPVPATKGGATEMLITNLLAENEKEGKINFVCISVYDEKAKKISEDYKYTEFIYINQKRDNLDLTFEKQDKYFEQYMDEIYEKIKDKKLDFIIIEGGDISGYEYLLKRFPKEKCIVHIHGDAMGNYEINNNIYSKFLAISKYTENLINKNFLAKFILQNDFKLVKSIFYLKIIYVLFIQKYFNLNWHVLLHAVTTHLYFFFSICGNTLSYLILFHRTLLSYTHYNTKKNDIQIRF